MTFSSSPQREVTPEERRRAGRFFWLVVLLFPMVVGTMVAYLSVKGRQVRDYGHLVYTEASRRHWTASGLETHPCTDFSGAALPNGATACEVEVQDGTPAVVIRMENGQVYRIKS